MLEAQRPVILNGIGDLATRGDLADRAITITLPQIPDKARRNETHLWDDFEAAAPFILARLLDAMVAGLARLPELEWRSLHEGVSLPRMADFALWGMAVAPALGWSEAEFLATYEANRATAQETVLEADPIAMALIRLVEKEGRFEGPATELLTKLASYNQQASFSPYWPIDGTRLSGTLGRLEPALAKAAGIEIRRSKSGGVRKLVISRAQERQLAPKAA